MNKIDELRNSFIGYNHQKITSRISKSEKVESWIRDTMNFHGIPYKGELLKEWKKCDIGDDKRKKRDAYCINSEGKTILAQLKWRQPDSGSDIEAAIIQPFSSLKDFINACAVPEKLDKTTWARDMVFKGHFYCVLNKMWDNVRVIRYSKIKKRINHILTEWCESGENLTPRWGEKTFRSLKYDGAILKCIADKGHSSFDSHVWKIMCYLPMTVFEDDDIVMLPMIEPPDYLFDE